MRLDHSVEASFLLQWITITRTFFLKSLGFGTYCDKNLGAQGVEFRTDCKGRISASQWTSQGTESTHLPKLESMTCDTV